MVTIIIPECVNTEVVIHKNEKRIKLLFKYNAQVIEKIRSIEDARWSATMNCWHIPYSDTIVRELLKPLPKKLSDEHKNKSYKYYNLREKKAVLNVNKPENLIYLTLTYDEQIIEEIKKISGRFWHAGAKIWSFENTAENLNRLNQILNKQQYSIEYIYSDFSIKPKIKFKEHAQRDKIPRLYLEQLLLENKSDRTIEVYIGFIAQLIKDFEGIDIKNLGDKQLRQYIIAHREQRGYSESYQNQMISAFKSFYRIIYHREFELDVFPRPKQGRYLPKVIPREDVARMFQVCHNDKHRMIIMLLYGFGLRIGELINLKVLDVDLERKQLLVVSGKGKKDRVLPISNSLMPEIIKYLKSYLPKVYFIEGQGGGIYNAKSAQNVIKLIANKAGIEQKITPHVLRHCYATHMLERGIDLRYIQRLLGHNSSKTTEIYTHVSMRKLGDLGSPFDDIRF